MKNSVLVRAWLFAVILGLLLPAVASGERLVGVMFSGNIAYYRSMHVALLNELKQKGLVTKDLKFINQFPAPDAVALSNTAKKLVVGGVDMIISYGHPATQAVLSRGSSIPIVFVGVYDPPSLIAQGENNVTGCGYKFSLERLLGNLREVSAAQRLGVIFSSNENDSIQQMNELNTLAVLEGLEVVPLDFNSRRDMDKLDELKTGDAVFLTGSTLAHVMVKDIMKVLRKKKILAVDVFPDTVDEGVVMAFYQSPEPQGQKAAELVAKVLGGESAANMPIEVLESPELVLNPAAAQKMGVTIPQELSAEAKRVVN